MVKIVVVPQKKPCFRGFFVLVAKGDILRICHLGMKQIPSRQGGIEVVVEQLATRMAALGHKVTCYNRSGHHVCGKEYDPQKKPKEYKGVKLVYVPTLNFRGFAAMTSSISAAICAAFGKYDVVHFHAEGPAFMCWLPKLFGKKVIVTIHGLDWQRAKWGCLASMYIMSGEKCAVKYADRIIVLSKSVQDYFWNTYKRKTVFIPNGINPSQIRKADLLTKQFGLTKDSYILFLGRLVPEKGLRYLFRAFREVVTDKKLVIAGGTSDTDTFVKELKQLGEGDGRILFTGFVQGQALEELYSNAYVYIIPSDLEGMPISLLEAMSYGNCCLVSDIPECTEVVEDKAVVFKKSNVDDLRAKLQELLDDSMLVAKHKKTAADYIVSKYNWNDVISKTIELYRGK